MLPALVVSEAVGYATISDPTNQWDDNVSIGLWPAHEYIDKILTVTLWVGQNQINGIETVYRVTNNPQPISQMRGQRNGTTHAVDVSGDNNKAFVGIYGSRDANPDQPTLRRLGFLVYNKGDGSLTPSGAFPPGPATGVTGFTSLGLMVAFSGTTSANGLLDTLSIYKFQSGQEVFGISQT